MRSVLPSLPLLCVPTLACNLTPTPWPDPSRVSGAKAPWAHPTDLVCASRDDPDSVEIDGFLFCAGDAIQSKIPVDDPRFVSCERSRIDGPVLAVFDGQRARGYSIARMSGREVVNDEWDGEPILVDF
jgi:hypothetical protein